MKLYTFRTVLLSIIRSLFTVHSAVVYVIHVCRQPSSRTRIVFHSGPARENLHVSESSSVHHQEFIHCTLSNGICHIYIHTYKHTYICLQRQLSTRTRMEFHRGPARKLSTNLYDIYHC